MKILLWFSSNYYSLRQDLYVYTVQIMTITIELSRAHTPRAALLLHQSSFWELHVFVYNLYLLTLGQVCAWAKSTWPAVGVADRHKCPIYDAHGPCWRILSILKPVFRRFRRNCCAYESLRCLYLQIWWFSWWRQTDDGQMAGKTDRFTPCAHVRKG